MLFDKVSVIAGSLKQTFAADGGLEAAVNAQSLGF